jgi:general secretion pathway protein C
LEIQAPFTALGWVSIGVMEEILITCIPALIASSYSDLPDSAAATVMLRILQKPNVCSSQTRSWSIPLTRLLPLDLWKYLPVLLNILLVLWIAWLISTAVRVYLEPPPDPAVTLPPVVLFTGDSSQIPANRVADWHLFGQVQPEKTTSRRPVNAPETKLNLVLRGISSSRDQDAALAIIANTSGTEEYFAAGQKVFELAILDKIYTDRVILSHHGRYETLRLPLQKIDVAFTPDQTEEAGPLLRGLLRNTEQDVVFELDHIESYVEFVPVFEEDPDDEDLLGGFKLVPIGEEGAEFLRKMGLDPGDVITTVNGIQLDSEHKAWHFKNTLMTAQDISLVVKRGGGSVLYFSFQRTQ